LISYDGQIANAKSPIALTMLGAPKGAKLHIKATGTDAVAAATQIAALIENHFGLKDTD
jgi:phosphotransferase system HPr (HPr) family protein